MNYGVQYKDCVKSRIWSISEATTRDNAIETVETAATEEDAAESGRDASMSRHIFNTLPSICEYSRKVKIVEQNDATVPSQATLYRTKSRD